MNEKPARPPIRPLTIWIPIVLIALGLVVFWNYLFKLKRDRLSDRLPIERRLEKNLTLTERSGRTVELKDLKGKVLVACWVFTRCPRGCPGVVGEMHPALQGPGRPSPASISSRSAWIRTTRRNCCALSPRSSRSRATTGGFSTAPRMSCGVYMTRYFGFSDVRDVPETERLSPDDKFVHDMRVALVDRLGQVRGFYDIGSPDKETREFYQEKIRKDIRTLLSEEGGAGRSSLGFYSFIGLVGGSVLFLIAMRIREGRSRPNP